MKKWDYTIGVDVSKLTLDIHCAELNVHCKIENGTMGFKQFLKWCKQQKVDLKNAMIVMEYTGGYEYKFIQFCESKSWQYCRVPGLSIKNSLGITRGKTDKVDAKRIAQYGDEKHKTIHSSKPLNATILSLKQLLSFRKRLVRETAGYKTSLQERIVMFGKNSTDSLQTMMNKKINTNNEMIKKLESEMMTLIQADTEIARNYAIITSIKGIGKVNALMTIAYTENFTCFKDARSYAVYVGVIPFDHSSGTSINGRKRVSHIANKELKQELNQAARIAIQWDKELKGYADKKRLTKPYKVVLNNVKFKLILRMFSLVKRGEFFVDNYKKAA